MITFSIETTSRPLKLWVEGQGIFWAAKVVAFITSFGARVHNFVNSICKLVLSPSSIIIKLIIENSRVVLGY